MMMKTVYLIRFILNEALSSSSSTKHAGTIEFNENESEVRVPYIDT